MEYPFDTTVIHDEYDIQHLSPPPLPYSFYVDYLDIPKFQSAIGVFTNFSGSSSITSAAFTGTEDDARKMDVTEAVEYLIDHNVTTVLYFGDADYNCN